MTKKVFVSSLIFLPFIAQLGLATPSQPSDYWGHILTGRELLENGFVSVDTLNIFPIQVSFHDYLGKIILYKTYRYRKIFKVLLLYLILIEALILVKGNVLPITLPYFLIAIYFYSPILRPMALGFPLFLLILILIREKHYLLTVPFTVLWAQIHAAWIYSPIAVTLYILPDRCLDIQQFRFIDVYTSRCIKLWKDIFLYVLIPILLAVWIHPYHFGLFKVFSAIGKLSFIKEWNTPDPMSTLGFLFWSQHLIALTMFHLSPRRVSSKDFYLFLIFTIFTIIAARNIPFQAVTSALVFNNYVINIRPKLFNLLLASFILALIFPLYLREKPLEYTRIDRFLFYFKSTDNFISPPGISDYIEFKTRAKGLVDTRLLNFKAQKLFEKFFSIMDGRIIGGLPINKILIFKADLARLKNLKIESRVVGKKYVLLKIRR